MSTTSKPTPPTLTPGQITDAFREHMLGVLVQNPVFRGTTVTYRNNGKTHLFRIKGFNDHLKLEGDQ